MPLRCAPDFEGALFGHERTPLAAACAFDKDLLSAISWVLDLLSCKTDFYTRRTYFFTWSKIDDI